MSETKKAVQVHHHPNGEGQQITLDCVLLPDFNSTSGKPTLQGSIASLLPSGSERAVSLRRLSEMAGLSERETRRAIQRERLQGAPICEAGAGYFVAENEEERRRWVRAMRNRARQILRAALAVERGGVSDG